MHYNDIIDLLTYKGMFSSMVDFIENIPILHTSRIEAAPEKKKIWPSDQYRKNPDVSAWKKGDYQSLLWIYSCFLKVTRSFRLKLHFHLNFIHMTPNSENNGDG